jgi:hypothetical protein
MKELRVKRLRVKGFTMKGFTMKDTTKKMTGGFPAVSGRSAGRFFPALTALALVFTLVFTAGACKTEAGEDDDGASFITLSLAYEGGDDPWYYSLPKGNEETYTEVSGPPIRSGAWDLAVEAHDRLFLIRTNSGDSAAEYKTRDGGGGLGGIWFTDKSFGAARVSDRVIPDAGNAYSEYLPYTEDCIRYVNLMSPGIKAVLNVSSYLGYPGGTGAQGDPFQTKEADRDNMASFVPFLFNKRGAYTMTGMPPSYTPTNRVYIVRHGDGDGYSKIQLVDAYIEKDDFVLKIKCAPAAD